LLDEVEKFTIVTELDAELPELAVTLAVLGTVSARDDFAVLPELAVTLAVLAVSARHNLMERAML